MQTGKQTFPSLTMEALGNGLVRLEDPAYGDACSIDIHPAQVQVLASMVGYSMPNKLHHALRRLQARLATSHAQAGNLEQLLGLALEEGEGIAAELTAAEYLASNLGELVADFGALLLPDIERTESAPLSTCSQSTFDL